MKRVGPAIAMGDARRGVTWDVMGDWRVCEPLLGDPRVAALLCAATTAQPEAPGRSPMLFRAEKGALGADLPCLPLFLSLLGLLRPVSRPLFSCYLTEALSSTRPLQGLPPAQGKVGTISC